MNPSAAQVVLILFLLRLSEVAASLHLTAATKHPRLKPRFVSFQPRFDGHTLLYSDANDRYKSITPFAAAVDLEPKFPVLILEDVEEHLGLVECSSADIRIKFRSLLQMQEAEHDWRKAEEFVVVTSSYGCSDFGEHQPYVVSLLESKMSSMTLRLRKRALPIRDVTHRVSVELGHHVGERIGSPSLMSPPYKTLQARQQSSLASSSNIQTLSSTPTFSIPYASPTEPAAGLSASADLSFSVINKTLIPIDTSLLGILPQQDQPPADVMLKCVNCTTAGTIEVTAGSFTADLSSEGDVDAAVDMLESGYLELSANGVHANMSLELSLLPGFQIKQFNPLLALNVFHPLKISGLLTLQPILEPALPISLTLNSEIDVFAGFTLDVPDNSLLYLDVGNISNSSTTGFDQASIKPLPFDVSAPNLSFNITAAFQPKVGIQFTASDSGEGIEARVSGGAGAYLNLPQLTTTITEMHNLSANCQPGPAPLYNDLINVAPSVTFGAGYNWDIDAALQFDNVGPKWSKHGGSETTVYSLPLQTGCFGFDQKKGGLVTPQQASGASARLSIPDARLIVLGMLALMVGGFY